MKQKTKIILDADMIFLYFAIKKGLMSIEEAHEFIRDVVKKGSKLLDIDFNTYISKIEI